MKVVGLHSKTLLQEDEVITITMLLTAEKEQSFEP